VVVFLAFRYVALALGVVALLTSLILRNNTLTFGNVLLGSITCLICAVFDV